MGVGITKQNTASCYAFPKICFNCVLIRFFFCFFSRGEKLYVTMDKRNSKKRNKCLCWGICLCIIAAAVIVGILAGSMLINIKKTHAFNLTVNYCHDITINLTV